MTYHDFQPYPDGLTPLRCAFRDLKGSRGCNRGRLHSIHFMGERVDRNISARMRELGNKPWSMDKSPWEGT